MKMSIKKNKIAGRDETAIPAAAAHEIPGKRILLSGPFSFIIGLFRR